MRNSMLGVLTRTAFTVCSAAVLLQKYLRKEMGSHQIPLFRKVVIARQKCALLAGNHSTVVD